MRDRPALLLGPRASASGSRRAFAAHAASFSVTTREQIADERDHARVVHPAGADHTHGAERRELVAERVATSAQCESTGSAISPPRPPGRRRVEHLVDDLDQALLGLERRRARGSGAGPGTRAGRAPRGASRSRGRPPRPPAPPRACRARARARSRSASRRSAPASRRRRRAPRAACRRPRARRVAPPCGRARPGRIAVRRRSRGEARRRARHEHREHALAARGARGSRGAASTRSRRGTTTKPSWRVRSESSCAADLDHRRRSAHCRRGTRSRACRLRDVAPIEQAGRRRCAGRARSGSGPPRRATSPRCRARRARRACCAPSPRRLTRPEQLRDVSRRRRRWPRRPRRRRRAQHLLLAPGARPPRRRSAVPIQDRYLGTEPS